MCKLKIASTFTPVKEDSKIKLLLWCGAIAPVFFITTFLIEGALRINYNPLRFPVSSLSIGENGWMQQTNFILSAILLFIFSIGLRKIFPRTSGKFRAPFLLMLVAIGLCGAGIFSSDPIYGYPEDQPMKLAQFTVHGHLHDLFSMLVFVCLPWACFSFRKKFLLNGKKSWANYSLITGILMLLFFVLAAIGFKQVEGFSEFAGLFQRSSLIVSLVWVMLLSIHFIGKSGLKEW
jgi:hypothetical protein